MYDGHVTLCILYVLSGMSLEAVSSSTCLAKRTRISDTARTTIAACRSRQRSSIILLARVWVCHERRCSSQNYVCCVTVDTAAQWSRKGVNCESGKAYTSFSTNSLVFLPPQQARTQLATFYPFKTLDILVVYHHFSSTVALRH